MKHAACTSSREPIPHSIHSAVSIPGDHGAVSEYETLNLPYKPHSEFHPEETMDNEVVPLCRAPSPWKISSTIGILSDPMLCVTPDKPRDSGSVSTRPSFNPQGKTVRPSSPVIYKPDPSLALTPEPSSKTVSKTATERDTSSTAVLKSNIRGNKNHEDDRDNIKLTQKVRFDIDSSPESDLEKFYPETSVSKSPNKIYQPLLYSDSKEATDNQNMFDFGEESRTIKYRVCSNTNHIDKKKSAKLHNVKDISDQGKITGVDSHDIDFTNIPSSEYSDFDENVKPKTISYRTSADSGSTKEKIPTDTYQSDDKIPVVRKPKRKVVVTREFEERPEIEDYQFPFSDDDDIAADIDSDCEHVFARPEYNSTLKLVTELKVMKESHPDVITVLHKKLTESEEKRTLINEKVKRNYNYVLTVVCFYQFPLISYQLQQSLWQDFT